METAVARGWNLRRFDHPQHMYSTRTLYWMHLYPLLEATTTDLPLLRDYHETPITCEYQNTVSSAYHAVSVLYQFYKNLTIDPMEYASQASVLLAAAISPTTCRSLGLTRPPMRRRAAVDRSSISVAPAQASSPRMPDYDYSKCQHIHTTFRI